MHNCAKHKVLANCICCIESYLLVAANLLGIAFISIELLSKIYRAEPDFLLAHHLSLFTFFLFFMVQLGKLHNSGPFVLGFCDSVFSKRPDSLLSFCASVFFKSPGRPLCDFCAYVLKA